MNLKSRIKDEKEGEETEEEHKKVGRKRRGEMEKEMEGMGEEGRVNRKKDRGRKRQTIMDLNDREDISLSILGTRSRRSRLFSTGMTFHCP